MKFPFDSEYCYKVVAGFITSMPMAPYTYSNTGAGLSQD